MSAERSWLLAGGLVASLSVHAEVPVIEVRPVDGGYASQSGVAGSGGNEMVLVIQQLQDEVRRLRGMAEQQQRRIEVLEQQQRDRYRDVDRRLSLLFQAVPADALAAAAASEEQQAAVAAVEQSAPSAADTATVTGEAQMSAASGSKSDVESSVKPMDLQAYEAVYALIRQRDFERAKGELDAFISAYPDSALIPNAWYWKGEVELARQDFASARLAFLQVIDNHASHGKAADALYKLGVLYGRSGDSAQAKQAMQRVISVYPQSSAADLARGYLTP